LTVADVVLLAHVGLVGQTDEREKHSRSCESTVTAADITQP